MEVFFQEETLWLNINRMADLFGTTKQVVSYHLQQIYESEELRREATVKEILTVQQEGAREVSRKLDFYNLDAIIAVGYRVNSRQATQFRHNAGNVSHEVAKALAEEEYSKFRVLQDRSFKSDFEKAAHRLKRPEPDRAE